MISNAGKTMAVVMQAGTLSTWHDKANKWNVKLGWRAEKGGRKRLQDQVTKDIRGQERAREKGGRNPRKKTKKGHPNTPD